MFRKVYCTVLLVFLLIIAAVTILQSALSNDVHADEYAGEKISYLISPFGRADYVDLGIVDFNGKKARLITFSTQVLWFLDTEKIYAQPKTLLPLKIERDVSSWFGRESIVEEYDQSNFLLTVTKFNDGKKASQQIIEEKGPIQNAILLAFYPRLQPRLDIGWSFGIRIPSSFEVKLVSIDEITVPAGKFKAYHFISNPDKFELWVNQDAPRIPVKIKGKGGLGYALVLKESSSIEHKDIK